MKKAHFILRSLEDNTPLANIIIQTLNKRGIIALRGDLGSGKTTFAQYLARALGIEDALTSPTFSLIHEYKFDQGQALIHSDLYRLNQQEIVQLGLEDHFNDPNTLILVEWADRMPSLFPTSAVWLDLSMKERHRLLTVTSSNEVFWQKFEANL